MDHIHPRKASHHMFRSNLHTNNNKDLQHTDLDHIPQEQENEV